MSLVKDGLARAWAEDLTSRTGISFFPHRHDGRSAPPFGVVLVKRLRATVPGDDVWEVAVRVVLVTDTVDVTAFAHQVLAGKVRDAIEATPRQGLDTNNGVRLCGFMLEEIEQAEGTGDDGRKVRSDVFMVTAGAARAS
jgi:hypothetical protein